jgi:response regulator RpfG family c-di-GMP phosphodiesterase
MLGINPSSLALELPPPVFMGDPPSALTGRFAEPTSPVSFTLDYLGALPSELSRAARVVNRVNALDLVKRCDGLMSTEETPIDMTHHTRTAMATNILCGRLGDEVSPTETWAATIAARLHDIGKTIPEIWELSETDEEWTDAERPGKMAIIDQHAVRGAEIVRAVAATTRDPNNKVDIGLIAAFIAGHHSFKAKGFKPYGLRPNRSILPAQSLALSDDVDALASKRSYKDSWTKQRTYDTVKREFGGDPRLVGLFFL